MCSCLYRLYSNVSHTLRIVYSPPIAPEDYTPQQFEVTIPAGELSVEVVIPITDDIFPEGLERFQVTFNVIDEQDEFIQMCGANTTTVTIVDNDRKFKGVR